MEKTAAFTLPQSARARGPTSNSPCIRVLGCATRELVVQMRKTSGLGRHYVAHCDVLGVVGEHPHKTAVSEGPKPTSLAPTPGAVLLDSMGRTFGDFRGLASSLCWMRPDRLFDIGFLPRFVTIVRALPRQRQHVMLCDAVSKGNRDVTHQSASRKRCRCADRAGAPIRRLR